jgi:hypothetical protein
MIILVILQGLEELERKKSRKIKTSSFSVRIMLVPAIATILKGCRYAAFMGAYEIYSFISENLRLVLWLVRS